MVAVAGTGQDAHLISCAIVAQAGLLTSVDDDGEKSKGLVFPPLMSNPDGDGQDGFRKNLEASVKFL